MKTNDKTNWKISQAITQKWKEGAYKNRKKRKRKMNRAMVVKIKNAIQDEEFEIDKVSKITFGIVRDVEVLFITQEEFDHKGAFNWCYKIEDVEYLKLKGEE